jgi:predicted PurR-regulated permease PerM
VLIGVALTILHVPLALPLAVMVFIAAFIPIVGAVSAGALATAVALVSQGPVTALIVLAVVVLIFELESHVLHPLIMSRAVSLHPLAVLLALTAGTILGGIIGAILAVPAASVAWAAVKAWQGEPVATNENPHRGIKPWRKKPKAVAASESTEG